MPTEGARVRHLYPPDWKGPRQNPAYRSLTHAYYGHPQGADWFWNPDPVQPGDVILVHTGMYKAERGNYGDPHGLWYSGTYFLGNKGTPERPIVIKAAGDGEVVFDGNGCAVLFDVSAGDYTYFEGLTIRNCGVAIKAGVQYMYGSKGLTVKRCKMEEIDYGIMGTFGGCRDFYIADNVIRGWLKKSDSKGWGLLPRPCGYGINVAGMSHVVCHNAISGFWDNLDVNTNCHPDPKFGRPAISIDFYNNDIRGECCDNAGEADGSVRNVRFLHNLGDFTCQPIWGGPVYFIRNFGGPTKMVNGPSGVIAYHNETSIASFFNYKGGPDLPPSVSWIGRVEFRNNVVHSVNLGTFSQNTLLDYNAYVGRSWRYASPIASVSTTEFQEFREKASQETHGVATDAGQSVKPEKALLADSPLIDRACILPNVNDDFTSKAPDIGPYEFGKPLPHYGPRTDTGAKENQKSMCKQIKSRFIN